MPFPYYDSRVHPEQRARTAAKFELMHLADMRRRAEILCAMGYGKEETRRWLRAQVLWEFEMNGRPAFLSRVDEVVDLAFQFTPEAHELRPYRIMI